MGLCVFTGKELENLWIKKLALIIQTAAVNSAMSSTLSSGHGESRFRLRGCLDRS